MSAAAAWGVAGLLLCALELLHPGVFLLPIGAAACGAGAVTEFWALGWEGQVGAFVVLAVVLVGLAALLRGRRPARDKVNAPGAGLIGESCRALAFDAGEGRVSLRDGTWQARVADASAPLAGEKLRVVGLEGTTLLVARDGASR